MDTIGRVINLANERSLSLFRLSQICDVPYSTLKNAENEVVNLLFRQSKKSATLWE